MGHCSARVGIGADPRLRGTVDGACGLPRTPSCEASRSLEGRYKYVDRIGRDAFGTVLRIAGAAAG
jgi:hypothetical protein